MRRILDFFRRGRTAVIGVPFVWLLVFFLIPFLVVLKISLSEMGTVSVNDIVTFAEGSMQIKLRGASYVFLTEDSLYTRAYLSSLCTAGMAGTQYALLTSLMAFGRTVLSAEQATSCFV